MILSEEAERKASEIMFKRWWKWLDGTAVEISEEEYFSLPDEALVANSDTQDVPRMLADFSPKGDYVTHELPLTYRRKIGNSSL